MAGVEPRQRVVVGEMLTTEKKVYCCFLLRCKSRCKARFADQLKSPARFDLSGWVGPPPDTSGSTVGALLGPRGFGRQTASLAWPRFLLLNQGFAVYCAVNFRPIAVDAHRTN